MLPLISDFQKLSLTPDPNQLLIPSRPGPLRGAYHDRLERWAWDAVDAAASARFWRGRTVPTRTAKSCGPDAPVAGVKFLRGSRLLGATVTNKLWSRRGEHGISRKPLRREGRSVSAEPVCSCAFLFSFAHETAGAARTRSFLRPLLRVAPAPSEFLGRMNLQNSGEGCRENADAYPAVIAREGGRSSIPERS
jgi:hypothetical protein